MEATLKVGKWSTYIDTLCVGVCVCVNMHNIK